MKITYKGIARAAGYRHVTSKGKYYWYAVESGFESGLQHAPKDTEQEAYEACCRVCGLVEEE